MTIILLIISTIAEFKIQTENEKKKEISPKDHQIKLEWIVPKLEVGHGMNGHIIEKWSPK